LQISGGEAAEAVSGTAVRGAGGAGAGSGKVGASVEGAAVVRTLVSTWMAAPGTNTSAKGDGHGISKTPVRAELPSERTQRYARAEHSSKLGALAWLRPVVACGVSRPVGAGGMAVWRLREGRGYPPPPLRLPPVRQAEPELRSSPRPEEAAPHVTPGRLLCRERGASREKRSSRSSAARSATRRLAAVLWC
jgi:hypothetical protein